MSPSIVLSRKGQLTAQDKQNVAGGENEVNNQQPVAVPQQKTLGTRSKSQASPPWRQLWVIVFVNGGGPTLHFGPPPYFPKPQI